MHFDAVRVGCVLGRLPIPNKYGVEKIAYLKGEVCEIKALPKALCWPCNTYKTKETQIAIIHWLKDGLEWKNQGYF